MVLDQVQRHPQLHQTQAQQQQHPGSDNAAQVCVQATAVLRNLAVVQSHSQLFVEQQGTPIAALLDLLTVQQHDEVILNVSRCLSKLSLHSHCRECILQWHPRCSTTAGVQCTCSNRSNYSSSLAICQRHCDSAVALLTQLTLRPTLAASYRAVFLRLSFVLANLTTDNAEARQQVTTVPGAVNSLLQLMHEFLHELLEQQEQQDAVLNSSTAGCRTSSNQSSRFSSPPVDDILTKLLRLLGNIAIDSVIGWQLAAQQSTEDVVMGVMCSCRYELQEELVLNAAAALTNLAFHNQPGNKVGAVGQRTFRVFPDQFHSKHATPFNKVGSVG